MTKLDKLLRLTASERALLLKTAAWIVGTHVALSLLPFSRVRAYLANRVRQNEYEPLEVETPAVQKIIWSIEVTSRYLLPRRPCLTKALVAQMLLAQQGYATTLRIGVVHKPDRTLQAHAWLERQGKIIVGYLHNLGQFTPLPPLEMDSI